MNNKMKKRTITGVAIISGAILVSVGVAGTVHLINENNAIEAKTYVTAKENNFNASTVTKEVNGITYALNDSDYSATVISIVPPTSGSSKIIGESKDGKSIFVNIPQSVTVNNTYTVRYIGDGSNSLFASNFEQYCSFLSKKQVNVILPKTVYSVSANAFKKSSTITTINVVNVSNTTTFANQQNANLTICGVSGSGAENGAINNRFSDMYSYDKNDTKKTAKITGFSSAALGIFNYLPDGVTVNFEIPTFISSGKYISTSIADNAFANKKFMKTLIIPGTVNSVGVGAFGGCSNINWVKFLGKNTSVSDNAFFEDTIDKIYALSDSKPKEFYTKNHSNGNYGINNASFNTLTLSSIDSVEQNPLKISYKVGEQLDTTGLVLKTTINDSGNPLTSYVASGFTCSPTTLNTSGNQTITVTYYDKTTTFVVNVTDPTPVTHTVTFNANGGTGGPTTQTKTYGASLLLTSEKPTRDGFTFKEWNTSVDGTGTVYQPGGYYSADEDVTLYAQWEESEIQVNLYDDDRSTVLGTLTLKDGYFYQDGNKIEKNGKFNLPTKEGYTFVSYNGSGNSTSKWILSDGTFGSEAQYDAVYNALVDLKKTNPDYAYMSAEWESTKHMVTFNANGGNGGPTTQTKTYGESLLLTSETPTKEGCTFKGWNTNQDGTGTVYQPGGYYSADEDVTLYAQWMQVVEPPANVPVESISLDKIEATIKIGGNIQLTATVTPDNATNKNVSWESSNTAVATVDNTGYVTAKSEGTATITAKTEDGEKTATATITIEKEITDNQGPTIISITGEKDLEGNYKVIIKATDESGIQKVLVNGAEITTKDSSGNFYFIPTKNGTYKIEVYDTEGNKTEQDYTENNIIEKTKITAEKDSNGNNIVYIETITNKKVTSVKVNGTEIKDKDSKGRYYFKPTQNGTYKVTVEYEDGTTEEVEYTENRITNNNNGNNSGNNNTNNGNSSTNNGNSSTNNGNNGSNNSGTNTGNSNKGSGTLTSGKSTSGNTIGTSTALTSLPKTGTKMGAFFAAIASGITAVFAWFKQRKEK